MASLAHLKFFATQPHSCSYLPDQQATTLFLDPAEPIDEQLYGQLSDMGFRRSGDHLYRPHCQGCTACIPARIPAQDLQLNRQQKRVIRRNSDLSVKPVVPRFTDEYYALYARYIETRHADGDMYPPSPEQFKGFLANPWPFTLFYEFRLAGRLLAVAVTDLLPQGLSAVYTFYDPDEEKRSLGRYAILWQTQESIRLQRPALYLGYWVKGCRKMLYKTEYRPVELLINQRWLRLN